MSDYAAPLIIKIPDDLLTRHPNLSALANGISQKFVHRNEISEQDLEKLGNIFWQALEMDDDFDRALALSSGQIVPIVIQSENPVLLSLPWECLYHPEKGFLSREPGFTFQRHIGQPGVMKPPPKGPLKVLLFTSQPDNLNPEKERLDTEAEQANVLDGLHHGIQEGLVVVEIPDDGRFSTLRDRVRHGGFHLVFMSGHGLFRDNRETGQAPTAFFQFEGEEGGSNLVEAQTIANIFQGMGVRCVVLSACQSGQHSSDQLNTGLATRLVQVGVSHVIGMRESVAEVMALVFSRAIWDALLSKERMDVAVQRGRESMSEQHLLPNTWRGMDSDTIHPVSGHWTFPLLYSQETSHSLIDWDFQAIPNKPTDLMADILSGVTLSSGIPMPQRFIGRRRDLREMGRLISERQMRQILITGAGGQGKTTLVGRVASGLQKRGYLVIVYSAPREHVSVHLKDSWNQFENGVQMLLDEPLQQKVNQVLSLGKLSEDQKANLFIVLLLQQANQRLVLLFDNLETVQDPNSGQVTLPGLHHWLTSCQKMGANGPLVLTTSRWTIPHWSSEGGYEFRLPPAPYGDFLRFVQDQKVRVDRDELAGFHKALNGNFQGLKLFIKIQEQEKGSEGFLARLTVAQEKLRVYMAVEQVVGYLSLSERTLLNRFRVFQTPVPKDAIHIIGEGLSELEKGLNRLVDFSLMDVEWDNDLYLPLVRISPLVGGWLQDQGEPEPTEEIQHKAARYLLWMFHNLNPTLSQALAAHEALLASGLVEEDELLILEDLAPYFDRRGMYHALLEDWLPLVQHSPRKEVRGNAIGWMGKICLSVGDYETALKYMQDSLKIRREIGDRSGEGTTLNNISQIYKARGEYETALNYLHDSLKIFRETGDRLEEGATLNNISQIYDARGEYETALNYLHDSLKIRREVGDKSGEGATLNNISAIHHVRGEYETALNYLHDSLKICREIGDRSGEGTTLNNISQIYKARGEYETALNYLHDSLKIRREVGDKSGEGTTLNNISQIYDARGEYETALNYLHDSLKICRKTGDRSQEGTTLNNISQIYEARGEYETALNYLHDSLKICRKTGDRSQEGTTLNNISAIHHARGEYETALNYLHDSLKICRKIGDTSGMCTTLFNMGMIAFQNKDVEKGLSFFVDVYVIANKIGLAQALGHLENVAQQLGGNGLDFWEKKRIELGK